MPLSTHPAFPFPSGLHLLFPNLVIIHNQAAKASSGTFSNYEQILPSEYFSDLFLRMVWFAWPANFYASKSAL